MLPLALLTAVLLLAPPDPAVAIAFAEARLVAAQDEPQQRREHLQAALAKLEAAIPRPMPDADPPPPPPDPRLFTTQARVLLALERPREASLAAERAVELAPKSAEARLIHADTLLRLGDDGPAEDRLDEAAGLRPPDALVPRILRQRARARLRLGNLADAAEDARSAAALEPSSAEADALAQWCATRLANPLGKLPEAVGGDHVVRSEIGREAGLAIVAGLGAVQSHVAEVFPPAVHWPRRIPVYLLTPGTFLKLAPAGREARAFYQRDEMAVYVLAEKPPEAERLALHEVAHAHIQRGVEDVPAWLDEGLADLLAADPHPIRLRDLKVLLNAGHGIRLRELVFRNRREFYDRDGLYLRFAAGWGWVRFLRSQAPNRFTRYAAVVRTGGSAHEAFADAFGDLDENGIAKLEAAWRDHIERIPFKE